MWLVLSYAGLYSLCTDLIVKALSKLGTQKSAWVKAATNSLCPSTADSENTASISEMRAGMAKLGTSMKECSKELSVFIDKGQIIDHAHA